MFTSICPDWRSAHPERQPRILVKLPLMRPREQISDVGICPDCLAVLLGELRAFDPAYKFPHKPLSRFLPPEGTSVNEGGQ